MAYKLFKPRRGTKKYMDSSDIILSKGEIFFETPDTGVGTGECNIKMGDGTSTYSDLPYAISGIGGWDVSTSEVTFVESSTTDNDELLGEISSGKTVSSLFGSVKTLLSNIVTLVNALSDDQSDLSKSLSDYALKSSLSDGSVTKITTSTDTSNALYPIGISSSDSISLKADTSVTMTGAQIKASDGLVVSEGIHSGNTVPYAIAITQPTEYTLTDMNQYGSHLSSVYVSGSTWYSVISCRHRNGASDGTNYGMMIYSRLTSTGDLFWNKQTGSSAGWQGERTIIDSSNYSSFLGSAYAPYSHASSSTTYGVGNASNYGHVKLTDTYTSNGGAASSGVAASGQAVYNAYANCIHVGGSSQNITSIELNASGNLANYGGFIDFHYNGSSSDYTSRIIESTSGIVSLQPAAQVSTSTAYTSYYVRNIAFTTSAPSSLSNGYICMVYS